MNKLNKTQIATNILILTLTLFAASCANRLREEPKEFTFAITGNTAPESPFVGFTDTLPMLYDAINKDNPLLIVHTGNFINGGFDWMGIKEEDMARQFGLFKKTSAQLKPLIYHVAGNSDLFNNDPGLFKEFTGKNINYSFNYSSIHFIIFNVLNEGKALPSMKQSLAWLRKDLETCKASSMIFLFTHEALFSAPRGEKNLEPADEIHSLLKRYPVSAVFSGSSPSFFAVKKDGISYINAGCGGFLRKDRYRNYRQYYIVTCKNNDFTVYPRNVSFFDEKNK